MSTDKELHDKQKKEREDSIEEIVKSASKYKIIVSGPGTGKTSAFQALLKTKKTTNNLGLTFIRNLAIELQKDLQGMANCFTFHAYSKWLLHKLGVDGLSSGFNYFPELKLLIASDSIILENPLEDFEKSFRELTDDEKIDFFILRANFYDAVGHDDAVYRVLKHFQSNPTTIPRYTQIVVDEYQDFVPLEVAFIDELSNHSPVLLAGDDDQAIYKFRSASPEFIRSKYVDKAFTAFQLPYCNRSTQVIVDAVNDVVDAAKKFGKLRGRVEKSFVCYLPKKQADSEKFPKIFHAGCSTNTLKVPYISKYIEKVIKMIPQELIDDANERGCPCVLIAGPRHYTNQVYRYLKDKFDNIDFKEKEIEQIQIISGYKILLSKPHSNLGWRIILGCDNSVNLNDVISESSRTGENLVDILDPNWVKSHLEIVKLLGMILKEEDLTDEEKARIMGACDMTIPDIKIFLQIDPEDEEPNTKHVPNQPTIKITTINGSKGLSANYVFLLAMNNGDFPQNVHTPTDNEICQFIVGLSRTRKECHLISNQRFGLTYGKRPSVFIDWINPERIETIQVNAQYWK